jgi:hypothetical protein
MHPSLSRLQSRLVCTTVFSPQAVATTGLLAVPTTLAIQLPRHHAFCNKRGTHHKGSTGCVVNRWRDLSTNNRGRSTSTQHSCASGSMDSGSADAELPGSLHTATLKDGRTVTYSMCGSTAPGAHTVLFLHPIQGNRWGSIAHMHVACAQELIKHAAAMAQPGRFLFTAVSTLLRAQPVMQESS